MTDQWYRKLIPGFAVVILIAGCASNLGVPETAPPATATLDPLALKCIHQAGRNDFCYAGDMLAEDTALLEEATRTFCLNNDNFWCSIYIWKDEETVARSLPLTDLQASLLIAKFTSHPNSGSECFQAYDNEEVVYRSDDCD